MGKREGRRLTRSVKASGQGSVVSGQKGPRVVACGWISGGVSETYVALRAMPTADEICSVAIRRVRRAIERKEYVA